MFSGVSVFVLATKWETLRVVEKTRAITWIPGHLWKFIACARPGVLTQPLAKPVGRAGVEALQCEYLFELCATVASVPYFLLAAATTGFTAVPIWAMVVLPALSVRSVLRQAEMANTTLCRLYSTGWYSLLSGLAAAFDGPSHVMGSINMWCRLTPTMHHRMRIAFYMTETGSQVFPTMNLFGLPLLAAAVVCLAVVQQLALSLHIPEIAAKLLGMDASYELLHDKRPTEQLHIHLFIFACQQFAENLPTLELQTTFLLAEGCGLSQDPVGTTSMFVAMAMAVKSCMRASTMLGFEVIFDCDSERGVGNWFANVLVQIFLIVPTFGVISHCLAKIWGLQTCPSAEWGVSSGCIPLCSSTTNGTCLPAPAC